MLRVSRLSDYALVVLSELTEAHEPQSASALARRSGLPTPTVAKLLKRFAGQGWVEARRGVHGGYRLRVDPSQVTVAQVLEITEGPVSLVNCGENRAEPACARLHRCGLAAKWEQINAALVAALEAVTLAELGAASSPVVQVRLKNGARDNAGDALSGLGQAAAPEAVPLGFVDEQFTAGQVKAEQASSAGKVFRRSNQLSS